METNHFALYNGKIVYVPDVPEVENQDEVLKAIVKAHNLCADFPLDTGFTYPLQCRVEIIKKWKHTTSYMPYEYEVARVTFEQPEKPRCPKCGYTKEDQQIHGDHHLCDGEIPTEPESAGQEQELSFESYCKLIGTGPHNEPAFTIYKTLKHHGYKITRKP